jgi:hypothetical protein
MTVAMTTTRRHLLALPAGAAALTVARPDRLAGYTPGERDVIAVCEEHSGRRLTAREAAFQIAWAETVLGPGCEG